MVTKVHNEALKYHRDGRKLVLVGHEGHQEVKGTMGQTEMFLVDDRNEVEMPLWDDKTPITVLTQTTLSVDDTQAAVDILADRFSNLAGPKKGDICYATTNRQAAVKAIAGRCDALFIIGALNSSNSRRLVEVAEGAGCGYARLIQRANDIVWDSLTDRNCIGISAGASAPEVLVDEVLQAFRVHYDVHVEEISTAQENMEFKLPNELRA